MKKIKGTKKARERYQTLSKVGKEKKRQYGRKYQKNLLKDEKKKKMLVYIIRKMLIMLNNARLQII